MVTAHDVRLDDGRVLRAYDSGADAAARLVLMWHHGSPQTGAPLEPVLAAAAARGIRMLSYDGMQSPGGLHAAMDGREARARYAETEEFDPEQFLPADFAALDGRWSALGDDVARSAEFGPDGLIDDDVAFAKPWGFELDAVRAPVLLVQGEGDRVVPRRHASWMLGRLPKATLWMRLDDGHVSVLDTVPDAMDWLLERAI
jgi:pimeloyl-ACP methyl ester carboxylesterase